MQHAHVRPLRGATVIALHRPPEQPSRLSTLSERSRVEQVGRANVCLVNGQPGGVEPDGVRSSAEILHQMTADPLQQVAGVKT